MVEEPRKKSSWSRIIALAISIYIIITVSNQYPPSILNYPIAAIGLALGSVLMVIILFKGIERIENKKT